MNNKHNRLILSVVPDEELPGHYTAVDEDGREVSMLTSLSARALAPRGSLYAVSITFLFDDKNNTLPGIVRESWGAESLERSIATEVVEQLKNQPVCVEIDRRKLY